MNTMQKILDLLISQIGYTETGSNITKYAKYFDTPKADGGAWQFLNTKKQGAEWCSLLILWAFCQIIGTEKTRELLGLPRPADNCAAGCKYFYEYLDKKGYKVAKSKGQAGAIIFFNTSKAKCGHVGYIEKVDDTKYYTIEGNKSNKVKRCSYVKNSSSIYAICMPDYSKLDEEKTEEPKQEPEKPAEKKTIDQIAKEVIEGKWGNGNARKKNLEINGYDYSEVQKKVNELLKTSQKPEQKTTEYEVKTFTGAPLNFRTKPDTRSTIIDTIKNGSRIQVESITNGWAKAKYNGITGYCTANRLKKR